MIFSYSLRKLGAVAAAVAICGTAATSSSTTITLSEEPVAPAADYNFLLFRNLRLDMTGLFGVTYDDNINTSENNEEESLYVTPRLRLAIDWPITPNIKIGSGIDIGYRYHITGDGNNDFYAGLSGDLDTGIKADILLGEGVLRVYDNYQRNADTIEIGGRVQDDEYILNRNTIGAHYRVDLTPYWSFKATADHRNTWTNVDTFESHDNVRDRVHITTWWTVNPQLELGPYYQWQQIDYDQGLNNDRDSNEFGFSFLYRTPGAIYFDGNLGYEILNIDSSPLANDETQGLVGRFAINYAYSEFTDMVLSVTHDHDQDILNTTVNYATETRYMYAIATEIMPDVTVRGNISLLDIDESDTGEQAKLWRFGLGTSFQIDEANQIRLSYTFYDKNSDTAGRDFRRNVFNITLVHDF